jgi:hypothetical protein
MVQEACKGDAGYWLLNRSKETQQNSLAQEENRENIPLLIPGQVTVFVLLIQNEILTIMWPLQSWIYKNCIAKIRLLSFGMQDVQSKHSLSFPSFDSLRWLTSAASK